MKGPLTFPMVSTISNTNVHEAPLPLFFVLLILFPCSGWGSQCVSIRGSLLGVRGLGRATELDALCHAAFHGSLSFSVPRATPSERQPREPDAPVQAWLCPSAAKCLATSLTSLCLSFLISKVGMTIVPPS